jgi:hypothetical protein
VYPIYYRIPVALFRGVLNLLGFSQDGIRRGGLIQFQSEQAPADDTHAQVPRVWLSVARVWRLHAQEKSARHVSVLWCRRTRAVEDLGLVSVCCALGESVSCGGHVDGMMGGKRDLQGSG